jgi:hypothetical protein
VTTRGEKIASAGILLVILGVAVAVATYEWRLWGECLKGGHSFWYCYRVLG